MRVCVIGAGVSGLPAIKACLEENLEVVCYEKTSQLGGLWNYRPDDKDVGATVMETTVVNTSKEMMAYSDFCPPSEWPNFMHHSKVNQYIQQYAEHYDLIKHIRFNTTVQKVERVKDKWHVDLNSGQSETFDKVMICIGHHAIPSIPEIKDLNKFKGKVMHAYEYRNFKGFEGKDVVLLGIGNSSLDIAVDIAKIAKSVTISTRRGSWIFNRVAEGGMPYDTIFMTRYYDFIMDTIPWSVANDYMEHRLQMRMDHDIYGLRPNHRFFQQHPTVNDALANLISAGFVKIADDVMTFTEDSVILKGNKVVPCDVFVMCTGYTFNFPFMSDDVLNVQNHRIPLYKFVFPPNNQDLAVIGLIQPIGSVAPISEMQSRWVARVFNGQASLPSEQKMWEEIDLKKKQMERRYFKSEKHTIQVDYLKYMDEIASLIGCRPNLLEIAKKDIKMAVRLFMGPNVPYVYRLVGPHSWSAAEEVIKSVPHRVKQPLKNRECRIRRHKKRGTTDEYFRYISMKWIAYYSILFFSAGLLTLLALATTGYGTVISYFLVSFIFFLLMSFMLLWFDLQYDMSTIL